MLKTMKVGLVAIATAGLMATGQSTAVTATTLKTIVNFDYTNGAYPNGSLISDAQGNLFGTTFFGGTPTGGGTVFELSPNGSNYNLTTLVNFNGINGYGPNGSLISDAQGNLFGTTTFGGTGSNGTVFELTDTPFQTGTTTQSVPEPSEVLGILAFGCIGLVSQFKRTSQN